MIRAESVAAGYSLRACVWDLPAAGVLDGVVASVNYGVGSTVVRIVCSCLL